MGNNADEAQRTVSGVPIAVRLARWDVQRDTRAHHFLPIGGFCHSFTLDHEDLVFIRMLMCLENCPALELNHTHSKIGGALGLPDDPSDGLILADGLFGNVAIISTQHIVLQN
jgi:hypothetical protein